eukprot:TRINITY_DN7111_c0_g4_i1.p1 TRINITY_DN7111_c0_g4~~TRINITY_DN7111_c0_g4_i1.p1  ORF type:complete len:339 (-),score=52.30 TRINITY_DN7111_c0_g4_i1:44-967(-)
MAAVSRGDSDSVVEAYLSGGRGDAFIQAPAMPVARRPTQPSSFKGAFSPRMALAATAQVARGPCLATPLPLPGQGGPTAARLLEGNWVPPWHSICTRLPLRPPATATGTSEATSATSFVANKTSARLQRHKLAPRELGEALSARGSSGDGAGGSSASSCGGRGGGCGGCSVAGSSVTGSGSGRRPLSDATTPSWRSRSFPANHQRSQVSSSAVSSDADREMPASARSRLPPLPLEARWAATGAQRVRGATSEMRWLDGIDSEVNEANAMLVESFLNVKRRPPSASTASTYLRPSESGVETDPSGMAD